MADYNTVGSKARGSVAQIDEGLRAHMNKVYGTMSVGMLITALAAWAISGLATTSDPNASVGVIAGGTMLTSFGDCLRDPRAIHPLEVLELLSQRLLAPHCHRDSIHKAMLSCRS